MKITKNYIKQVIKEELQSMEEVGFPDNSEAVLKNIELDLHLGMFLRTMIVPAEVNVYQTHKGFEVQVLNLNMQDVSSAIEDAKQVNIGPDELDNDTNTAIHRKLAGHV